MYDARIWIEFKLFIDASLSGRELINMKEISENTSVMPCSQSEMSSGRSMERGLLSRCYYFAQEKISLIGKQSS